jgi:hypothetical protein
MVKRSCGDLFVISGKWLWVYLELFLNTSGLLENLWTMGYLWKKAGGSLKSGRYFPPQDLFSNRKSDGPGPWRVDSAAQLESIMDRGGADKRARRCPAGAWRAGARAHRCSLATVEEDEPDEAVPKGSSPEHERRRRTAAARAQHEGEGRCEGAREIGEKGR